MGAIASLSLNLTADTAAFSRGLRGASGDASTFARAVSTQATSAEASIRNMARASAQQLDGMKFQAPRMIGGGAITGEFSRGLNRASEDAARFGDAVHSASGRATMALGSFARGSSGSFAAFAKSVAAGAASLGVYDLAVRTISGTVAGIKGSISAATSLADTVSKTKEIFGASAGDIISESNRMAEQFGTVKNEYIDSAASFGAVFKGLGKSQKEAAALGNSLVKLGMDMASFEGGSNSEAFTAISSALRGEFDPIERFRVFLTADAVAAEALSMGLAKSKGQIDETSKKMATMSLIMKGTKDAQGDLARTAGETSNQQKKLQGTLINLSADIGKAFTPAVNGAVGAMNSFATSAARAFKDSKPQIEDFARTLEREFTAIGVFTTNFGTALEIAELRVGAFTHNVEEEFKTLGKNVGEIGSWLATRMKDTLSEVKGAAKDIGAAIKAVGPVLQGKAFVPELEPMKPNAPNPLNLSTPKKIDVGPAVREKQKEIEDRAAGKPITTAKDVKEMTGPPAPAPGPAAAAPAKGGGLVIPPLTDEMKGIGQRVRDSLDGGVGQLERELNELRDARNSGAINPLEFRKAATMAEAKFNQKDEFKPVGAAKLGSSEAYSSIVGAMSGKGSQVSQFQQGTFKEAQKQTIYQAKQLLLMERLVNRNTAGTEMDEVQI